MLDLFRDLKHAVRTLAKSYGFTAMASLMLAAAVMSGGCGVLEPRLPEAAPSIPAEWPLPATTAVPIAAEGATAASPGTPATADIGWRDFFVDPKLEAVIAQALANNRDLRVAILNVEQARARVDVRRVGDAVDVQRDLIAHRGS